MAGLRLPLNPLQLGIYSRLRNCISDIGIYCPVAPASATPPFLVVQNFSCLDVSLKDRGITDWSYEIHVWHPEEESLESINDMLDSVVMAMTVDELTLGEYFREIDKKLSGLNVSTEQTDAGLVQHAVVVFTSKVIDNLWSR